ncbi:MAG: N-acetylmuramoyl-L-alanine amidase [Bacteroidota bacterium]
MLKKSLVLLLFVAATALLLSFSKKPGQQVLKTIIIDAGHGVMPGGGYNGAHGKYSYEDEICYEISKKLVTLVGQQFPDVKIIETRPTRSITALHTRADIANQNRGDLFISIHVNAMPPIQKKELTGYKNQVYYTKKGKKKIKHTRKVAQYRYYEIPNTRNGTETYIWGAHKGDEKETAVRENAPMLAEENYKEKYGEIDPNSPEFVALSLVKTKQFGKRSATFAGMVEDEFTKVGRVSLGAKQRRAGIWVLQATAMPSILVETGFITNPQEEDYLNSEAGQQETAGCVAAAIKNYIDWIQKKQSTSTGATVFSTPTTVRQSAALLKAMQQQAHNHSTAK